MGLPSIIVDLQSWLENEGFEIEAQETDLPFGELFVQFRRGAIGIRIGRDRDGWYLVLRGPDQEDAWYDISIWRAYLDQQDSGPTPSVEDSIEFLKARLADIESAIERGSATGQRLAEIGLKRAQSALHLPTDLESS